MLALLPLIQQIFALALEYGPELAQDVELIVELLKSGRDPTPEQQAQIDAALDRAHAALQAAIAAKAAPAT